MMNSFRQVCDKPCANSIMQAEWSPLHDLIAVVTSNGDVRLHRMYWQKVWMIPANENLVACCLAWKTNGKLLAIGYTNGDVVIVEIEKAVVVHTLKHKDRISTLNWTESPIANMSTEKISHEELLPEIKKEELHSGLLQGDLLIADCNRYCCLTVGTSTGSVYVYLEGVLILLEVSLEKYPLEFQEHCILSTHLTIEDGLLTVISKSLMNIDEKDEVNPSFYVHQFGSVALRERKNELLLLSVCYCKIFFLVQRCEKLLKQMSDASEDISLKINSKLEKLEGLLDLSTTNVAAEFTLSYTAGDTSAELQSFLTQNLTTKGLKQIEQNVQSAYKSMHVDINDELEIIVQHIMFHLLQLIGMAKWTEKYEAIGLTETHVQNCLKYITQFSMKLLRLLEAISSDMEEFSIFFGWLTSLCFQFSGEAQPTFPQLSFKDYDIMIDFLENRLQKVSHDAASAPRYNIERVSQFFRKGSLDSKLNVANDDNIWLKFLEGNPQLKHLPFIVTPDKSSTLQEVFSHFKKSYIEVFNSVRSSITDAVNFNQTVNLFEAATGHEERCSPVFSILKQQEHLLLSILACSCDSDRMFFVKLPCGDSSLSVAGVSIEPTVVEKGANVSGSNNNSLHVKSQYTIRSVEFYNQDHITVLFEESHPSENDRMTTILAQLPLSGIFEEPSVFIHYETVTIEKSIMDDELDLPWVNVIDKFSEQRRMTNFHGKFISVNGYTREVCALVSVSGRRVRIFDMTVSDDEQDESKLNESSQLNISKESTDSKMS